MRTPDKGTRSRSNRASGQSGVAPLTLARIYLQTGALQDAITLAKDALSNRDDNRTAARLVLADALRLSGHIEAAQGELSRIDRPSSPALQSELRLLEVRLLVDAGLYNTCLERYSIEPETTATNTLDVLVGRTLARCHARLQNLAASRRLVEWTIHQSERLNWEEGIADGLMSLALLDRIEGAMGTWRCPAPGSQTALQQARSFPEVHSGHDQPGSPTSLVRSPEFRGRGAPGGRASRD